MSKLPAHVTESRLWRKVNSNEDLRNCLKDLRKVAEALGAQVGRVLPEYTDHSVEHMDALWRISDVVFKPEEINGFTTGEAFLLGSCFYVHDLGMALAATSEGLAELKSSAAFTSSFEKASTIKGLPPNKAEEIALRVAARQLHAEKSEYLAIAEIPGLGRYLFESSELREKWAALVGLLSASHHWSISEVHNRLGARERIPSPIGDEIDLGLIACALRTVDYAHIDSGRARYLDRVLRTELTKESLIHWQAQEHISGPTRQADQLVFASQKPIKDVDAWWLFYEMAYGLDTEIRSVAEYLAGRAVSRGRFSLEGVKKVLYPHTFSELVQPDGFQPIDVRFRATSMERLVEILGGRTLYGRDRFAAIRELLQNARDAISLDRAAARIAGEPPQPGEIQVRLKPDPAGAFLEVCDDGVGMTQRVISDYLLGVASDYWRSSDFFADFPGVASAGFRAAGRFGIGFLSVFMVGNNVEVETQRRGHERLVLHLRGVGRRGSLVSSTSRARSGTTVRVSVSADRVPDYENLAAIVRCRAPMLDVPVVVSEKGAASTIPPRWWADAAQEELYDFVNTWEVVATTPIREQHRVTEDSDDYTRRRYFGRYGWFARAYEDIPDFQRWPGKQPELLTDSFRILAIPDAHQVLLCSRGVAVGVASVGGVAGIVEAGDLELTAARTEPLKWDAQVFRGSLMKSLRDQIITGLNNLEAEGRIPSRFGFLSKVGNVYGPDLLLETKLPWITIIESPGNGRLISPKELADIVRSRSEILVGYGLGPWSVESKCREIFPRAGKAALLVPISDDDEPRHGSYDDKDELTRGRLQEHFSEESCDGACRLMRTLEIIAMSWNINAAALTNANWCREKGRYICGHLARDKL